MPPSSNWLALKKNLKSKSVPHRNEQPRKRRKVEASEASESEGASEGIIATVRPDQASASTSTSLPSSRTSRNRDSLVALRNMVYGQDPHPPVHQLPGMYLAIDCEMVGIAGNPSMKNSGIKNQGDESSLARVSVVNYYGAVQLDVFVRQRERVTDWRTAVSGVRESDMANAKSFSEVQKLVADLLKDRILVGHAVHNDLKALLLSHPHNMTRDTQVLAGRHGTLVTTNPPIASSTASTSRKVNRKPALRKLVTQELGIDIQAGEHSSVIDARATMAIYRLHRKIWDRSSVAAARTINSLSSKTAHDQVAASQTSEKVITKNISPQKPNRTRYNLESTSQSDATVFIPDEPARTSDTRLPVSAKQQGISSGLSVVVKRRRSGTEIKQITSGTRSGRRTVGKNKWWESLGE